MGFFSKLFGSDRSESTDQSTVESLDYQGFQIVADARKVNAEFQVYGSISKAVDGEPRTYEMIRSDYFMTAEDANEVMIRKSKQLIDQVGEGLFQ